MAEEMKHYVLQYLEQENIGNDYVMYRFAKPHDFHFVEGQYGVFMHVDKVIEGKKIRPLSIASCQDDDEILIATKIIKTPSDFKQKMLELTFGDSMTFDGPMGQFTLDETFDAVFIAGGIGITPIRSIIRQIEQLNFKHNVELLYSEAEEMYPFHYEFDELDFLNVQYRNTIDNTKESIEELAKKYQNSAIYYIAGSPGFVTGIKEQLSELNIQSSNIKFDRFTGY